MKNNIMMLKLQVEKLGYRYIERFIDRFTCDVNCVYRDYDSDEDFDYYEIPIGYEKELDALNELSKAHSFGIDVKVL